MLSDLYDHKVGARPDDDTFDSHVKVAMQRFANGVPPGFKDREKKTDERQAGDYVIWRQCLDECNERSQGLIFVTEDNKEDWWWKERGKTVGPLPLLREEFHSETLQDVHFYNVGGFLTNARQYRSLTVTDQAVEEVESVAKQHVIAEASSRYAAEIEELQLSIANNSKQSTVLRDEEARLQEMLNYNDEASIPLTASDETAARRRLFDVRNERNATERSRAELIELLHMFTVEERAARSATKTWPAPGS